MVEYHYLYCSNNESERHWLGWLSQSPSIYPWVNCAEPSSESALLLSLRGININGSFLHSWEEKITIKYNFFVTYS